MAKAAGKDPQPPSPEINDPGRSRPVASASHTSVTQAPTSIWPEPEPEPEPRLGELPPQPLVGERYVGDFITTRHIVWFSLVLGAALVISAVWLHATADIGFRKGILEMSVKLLKTSGFRQTLALLGAIMFVRLGLEPAVRLVRNILGVKGAWLQSSEYYLLKEVRL